MRKYHFGDAARYTASVAHENILYHRKRYIEIRKIAYKHLRNNDINKTLIAIQHCNELLEYMRRAKAAAAGLDRAI